MSRLAALFLVLCVGCSSGPDLSDEDRLDARTNAVAAIATVGLRLEPDEADCVLDGLDPATAQRLVGGAEPVPELAEPVVACVGSVRVGQAALSGSVPAASADELECAAERLDADLVRGLVARAFGADGPATPATEVAVASALGLCLELETLATGS